MKHMQKKQLAAYSIFFCGFFSIPELNNRKILEDLQHKKQQIIQKGVSPIVASFQNIPVNNMPLVEYFHSTLIYFFFLIQSRSKVTKEPFFTFISGSSERAPHTGFVTTNSFRHCAQHSR